MSRHGYNEDFDGGPRTNLWRGAVTRAINGNRGQAFLRELVATLDAMPVKALITSNLVTADGQFCAIGAVGHARGINMAPINADDCDQIAKTIGVAPALVMEIEYTNDEGSAETPAERWRMVRDWALDNTREDKP